MRRTTKAIFHYFAYLKVRDDFKLIVRARPGALALTVSPKPHRLGIIPLRPGVEVLYTHGVPVVDQRCVTIEYLDNTLYQAHRYAVTLLAKLNSYARQHYTYSTHGPLVGVYKQGLLFINDEYYRWSFYNRLVGDYAAVHGQCFNLLPGSFILPLVVASSLDGVFSDRVKKNLYYESTDIKVRDSHAVKALFEQARIFNKVLGHYKKNRIIVPLLHDYYQMFYSPIPNRYYDSKFYTRIRAI